MRKSTNGYRGPPGMSPGAMKRMLEEQIRREDPIEDVRLTMRELGYSQADIEDEVERLTQLRQRGLI